MWCDFIVSDTVFYRRFCNEVFGHDIEHAMVLNDHAKRRKFTNTKTLLRICMKHKELLNIPHLFALADGTAHNENLVH